MLLNIYQRLITRTFRGKPLPFWTVPSAMLGSAAAAGGLALINSIGILAGFITPIFVGWIKDITSSTDIALYVLSVSVFIGSLLILKIPGKLLSNSSPQTPVKHNLLASLRKKIIYLSAPDG